MLQEVTCDGPCEDVRVLERQVALLVCGLAQMLLLAGMLKRPTLKVRVSKGVAMTLMVLSLFPQMVEMVAPESRVLRCGLVTVLPRIVPRWMETLLSPSRRSQYLPRLLKGMLRRCGQPC